MITAIILTFSIFLSFVAMACAGLYEDPKSGYHKQGGILALGLLFILASVFVAYNA